MKKLLRERIEPQRLTIVESGNGSGGRLKVRGLFQLADTVNGNGRIYPKKLWEKVLNDEDFKRRLESRRVLGEVEHPDGQTHLDRVSHVVTRLWMKDNKIFGEAEVLDTPQGKIIQELIKADIPVGISSRGVGTSRNENGVEVINEDDYVLETFDFVCTPSTPDAYIDQITERLHPAFQDNPSEEDVQDLIETISKRVGELRKNGKSENRDRLIEAYLGLVECEAELDHLICRGVDEPRLKEERRRTQYYRDRIDRKIAQLERKYPNRAATDPDIVEHTVPPKDQDAKYWRSKYESLKRSIEKKRAVESVNDYVAATKQFADRLLVAVNKQRDRYSKLSENYRVLKTRYDKAIELLGGIIERHDRGRVVRAVRESVEKHPQLRPLVGELLTCKSPDEVFRKVETFLRALKADGSVTESTSSIQRALERRKPTRRTESRRRVERKNARRPRSPLLRERGKKAKTPSRRAVLEARKRALERVRRATERLRSNRQLRAQLEELQADLEPERVDIEAPSKAKDVLKQAPIEESQLERSNDYGTALVNKVLKRGHLK